MTHLPAQTATNVRRLALLAATILLLALCAGCRFKETESLLIPTQMTKEDSSVLSGDLSQIFRQHYVVNRSFNTAQLFMEVWREGELLERVYFKPASGGSSLLPLPQHEGNLDITHRVKSDDPAAPWQAVVFQAALDGQRLDELTFPLPDAPAVSSPGASWLGGGGDEGSFPILDGEERILLYLPFSPAGGEAPNVYDCTYLMTSPEVLKQYTYALVLKVQFLHSKPGDEPQPSDEASAEPATFTDLDEAVADAIDRYSFPSVTAKAGDYLAAAHHILGLDETEDTATVYVIATKLRFSLQGGPSPTGGGYKPAVVTFDKNSTGRYLFSSYWQPEDGEDYNAQVAAKFPKDLVSSALNIDPFVIALSQQCYADVMAHSNYDPIDEIQRMVDLLTTYPEDSDVLDDHIALRSYDYNQLLLLGDYTLRYVFGQFLHTPQEGLRGQLLAKLLSDLLGGESIGEDYQDGQAYFERWKAHVLALHQEIGITAKSAPKANLLLQAMEATE